MAFAGATITHAALKAGFSSPAHFSAAFREMFGMAPTQLLAGTPIFSALLPGMHHRVDRHGDRQDHSIILIGLDLHTV